jgi:hypothetical protein
MIRIICQNLPFLIALKKLCYIILAYKNKVCILHSIAIPRKMKNGNPCKNNAKKPLLAYQIKSKNQL